jgi:tetratricopeptide (TPR) repeat protein
VSDPPRQLGRNRGVVTPEPTDAGYAPGQPVTPGDRNRGRRLPRGKPRSLRQAQSLLAGRLRAQGRTWAEVATEFRAVYKVNARVALRQAHGWSQPQAAAQWNARWPDDPKTFKNFSYWELWPGGTGHAPSLDILDRLARLYECSVADLLSDCIDYGTPPALPRTEAALPASGAGSAGRSSARDGGAGAGSEHGQRLRQRMLLLEASSALAVAAASPALEIPRGAATFGRPARTDQASLGYTADVVAGLRQLGGAVGPRVTLPPAMALRSAMAAMARNSPATATAQALAVYGDLTQLVGWLMFNLGDRGAARCYYDDARSAADRAGDAGLVSYTLAAASQLALAEGEPRQAIDHAQAGQHAARRSGSPHAVAYAADAAARAYAAAGQAARCQAALDRERAVLGEIGPDTPRAPWWYFYDLAFYWGTESECALRLGRHAAAADAAGRSLRLAAPAHLHNSALTLALQAEALIKQGEIDDACRTLADAARLSTLNSSPRITRRIERLRGQLRTADHTAAVRDLDEKLASFRRARAAGLPA